MTSPDIAPGLFLFGDEMPGPNIRKSDGSRWRDIRKRWRAIGAPCALCGLPIDYSLGMITDPRTGRRRAHPMSFVVDHIDPLKEGGAVYDFDNTQPAHWICNARKGASTASSQPATSTAPLPQPWEL